MEEILHHLRCAKPCKYWDKATYQLVQDFWTNNSMCQISTLLEVFYCFYPLGFRSNSQPHSEATFFFWRVGLETTCVFLDSKYFSIFTLGLGKMIQFDDCAYFSNGWFFHHQARSFLVVPVLFPLFSQWKEMRKMGDLWSIQWEPGPWRLKWLPSEHVLRPWRTGASSEIEVSHASETRGSLLSIKILVV